MQPFKLARQINNAARIPHQVLCDVLVHCVDGFMDSLAVFLVQPGQEARRKDGPQDGQQGTKDAKDACYHVYTKGLFPLLAPESKHRNQHRPTQPNEK